MKLSLIKRPDGLFEPTEQSQKSANKLETGEIIEKNWNRVRDPLNFRRFWKMLDIVFENQSHFKDIDTMRRWLIMKSGRFIEYTAPNGYKCYEHQSIAYDKLSEDEFCKLKEDVCQVAVDEILSDITQDEIWIEVEIHVSMLGNYHGKHDLTRES